MNSYLSVESFLERINNIKNNFLCNLFCTLTAKYVKNNFTVMNPEKVKNLNERICLQKMLSLYVNWNPSLKTKILKDKNPSFVFT